MYYTFPFFSSYVGYGEKTMPLMKALHRDLKPIHKNDYFYTDECSYVCTQLDYSNGEFIWRQVDADTPSSNEDIQYADIRYVILYLDKDAIDDLISKWEQESRITIFIAILPKREEESNRREKAITNLHKLYDAGKAIYLMDEEKIEGEKNICQEICQLANGLAYCIMAGTYFSDDRSVFYYALEKGFIYYAENEDYQIEKAFDVQKFIQDSHLPDHGAMTFDQVLFRIYCSHENEFLIEHLGHINNQFKLIKTGQNRIKWAFGFKQEEDCNDNFHCYAFFVQDKFPEYLEKRINLCHGLAEYAGSFASDLRTNKKIRIMETMNYFMEQELEREAWEKLSREFHWSEDTLKKCRRKVDWKEISNNDEIYWTDSMLEAFKNDIDWKTLSGSRSVSLLRVENLEKYKERWDWKELSDSQNIQWSLELIDRFIEYWDWETLINNYELGDLNLLNRGFLEKYRQYIPESELKDSRLWRYLREEKVRNLVVSDIAS